MADHPSKVRWEKENVLKIQVKINKNQDPELYQALSAAPSKGSLARDLMNIGLKYYWDHVFQTANSLETNIMLDNTEE